MVSLSQAETPISAFLFRKEISSSIFCPLLNKPSVYSRAVVKYASLTIAIREFILKPVDFPGLI